MTQRNQIYRCEVCGNVVEILHGAVGQLVCCGKPMVNQVENTVDASKEKHVPVMKKEGGKAVVEVGAVPHPMEEKHYIELIEVLGEDGSICRQYLKPGDKPQATFCCGEGKSIARAYCNLHGLWKA